MSAEIDDGGPAFPSPGFTYPNGELQYPVYGMPLRDWLATHATEEDIEHHQSPWDYSSSSQSKPARTREEARYKFADAMIRTRKGGTDGNR